MAQRNRTEPEPRSSARTLLKQRETFGREELSKPKPRTARTVPGQNCYQTELGPSWILWGCSFFFRGQALGQMSICKCMWTGLVRSGPEGGGDAFAVPDSQPPIWGHQKGVAPICSDLLRFLPICSEVLPEQIRTNQGNPFCRPLLQAPE